MASAPAPEPASIPARTRPKLPGVKSVALLKDASLIWQLVRREIAGRYRGSMLGTVWSLLTPLFMLGVYTFVFGTLLQSRWTHPQTGAAANSAQFAVILFAGLIIYQFFAEVVGRAPTVILAHTNYVKKIVFPLEILPLVTIGSAMFHAGISLLVLLAFVVFIFHGVPLTILLLPLVLLPLVLLVAGLSWLLSALGVFLRDINQFLGPILTALMFLSPVFFPLAALPEWVRPWVALNPIALPVEQMRDVMIFGVMPNWLALLAYTIVAAGFAWLGYWFFQKVRKGFADVL